MHKCACKVPSCSATLILFNSKLGVTRSVQILRQLCVKKAKKQNLWRRHTRTPLAAAICPFMSLLLSSRPVLVCMISEAKEAVDHNPWKTLPILFQQLWQLVVLQHCEKVMISNFPKFVKICEFREGISEKFGASIVLLSANFRAVRTVVVNVRLAGTKIRLRTKGEYRSSTFDELLMKGRMKETSQRLNNNENNLWIYKAQMSM